MMGEGGGPRPCAEDEGEKIREAVHALRSRLPIAPKVFIVLGSGLGGLARSVADAVEIPFGDVPGLPLPGVAGHAGHFVAGTLEGVPVLLQAGRFHLYEGHDPAVVVRPVRIAAELGADTLIVTNAAGGLDLDLVPGTLLLLNDQINFQFRSALAGPVLEGEPRFPDMSAPYDAGLRARAREVAAEAGIPLPSGCYVAVLGPSYETAAEVRMLGRLGAQAVGMSTVLEVAAARARGLRVLGISLITNHGAGLVPGVLDHAEVLQRGAEGARGLETIVRGVLRRL